MTSDETTRSTTAGLIDEWFERNPLPFAFADKQLYLDCKAELAKQAERVAALEGLVEFFYGQMYMTSPKMNGQHTYRFRSGGWPMTHCIGPTAEAAVEAAMKEIERDKQEQIERAAVLRDSTGKTK